MTHRSDKLADMARLPSLTLAASVAAALFLLGLTSPVLRADGQGAAPAQAVPPLDADLTPFTARNLVGHHLWVIVFDKSSMQTEDIRRAALDALRWANAKTPNVDVVAVALISSTGLELLQDFTTDTPKLQRALEAFGRSPLDPGAVRLAAPAPDLDALSNDTRSTGLKTICDTVKPWEQKKDILYFATAAPRGNDDSQAQYRDAVNACEKAHVAIDSVDARGLTASTRGGGSSSRGAAPAATATTGTRGARGAAPGPIRPDFSGTWQCDSCPPDFMRSSSAISLGPTFRVSYTPTDLPATVVFQASSRPLTWTFNLGGSSTVNVTPAAAGDWLSTLSWDQETLVLTMTGTIEDGGRSVPVTVTHVLSFITASGAARGDLKVVTTSTPTGLLPDGVCLYKKTE